MGKGVPTAGVANAKQERDWETEEDMRAMRRMAEVKKDKGRMSRMKSAMSDDIEGMGAMMDMMGMGGKKADMPGLKSMMGGGK